MSELTFQQENDNVLNFLLEKRYFARLRRPFPEVQENVSMGSVEIYLTSACSQNCSYCYLTKHGDLLYPPEIRNDDLILKNLTLFLDWMMEQEFNISSLDLFSGEIWGYPLGDKVLDTILSYISKGLRVLSISIPSNSSFLLSDKRTKRIYEYIRDFKKAGTRLYFSLSIDGAVIESTNRPFKDRAKTVLKDDSFYDRAFVFAKECGFGFHPMVSASTIDSWIENYDWWVEMYCKYNLDFTKSIMFLEVRNDDWTADKIATYIKFLEHMFDHQKSFIYKNDVDMMALDLMRLFKDPRSNIVTNYSNLGLLQGSDRFDCSLGRSFAVRMGDLAVVPCHRLSYDKLLYGHMAVEDGKIVGIRAKNNQIATRVLTSRQTLSHTGCDTCHHRLYCMRGCAGSQYEATKDPFIPIESVCNMWKARIDFLYNKYEREGLWGALLVRNFGKHFNLVDSRKSEQARRTALDFRQRRGL